VAFAKKNKSFLGNPHNTWVSGTSRFSFILLMSSTSGSAQKAPGLAVSSNFHRRVQIVGGCRENGISAEENRKGCDRHWMLSSVHVISTDFFLASKSLLLAAFETGSRLFRLEARAFCGSGLTSIHLPASVPAIGEDFFSCCGSLASISFDCASQLREIHPAAFIGVPVEALILPGGIRHLSGSAFTETRLETLFFSLLSKNFTVSGSIVEDISGRCLIWYLGKGTTVRIESSIEYICEGCFMSCKSDLSVVFEANSQLSRLQEPPSEDLNRILCALCWR
jgi:hypothetical protein